jgi:exosortase A
MTTTEPAASSNTMGSLSRSGAWRPLAAALLMVAAVLWAFWDSAVAMAAIWARSDTFMHGALVPGLVVWLMWRNRGRLTGVPLRAEPWWLLGIALACFAWLLGELAAVSSVSQLALTTVMVLAVPALFGWSVARVLAFPLAFLYFAVPVGEFAVPWLMMRTADATAFALSAVGIPVYREGLELIIPSGQWSVVEACSGLRYLVASFMVGTLYAYLTYTHLHKRLLFVLASLVVPLVANWARAFLTVLLGHVSGNELATGVDHLIYGWVFFGLVIGLMFWVGLRWADDPRPAVGVNLGGGASQRASSSWPQPTAFVALIVVLGSVIGSQLAWRHLQQAPSTPLGELELPKGAADAAGSAHRPLPWVPGYVGPSRTASITYERGDHPVWMWVGYYRQPGGRGKLVSSSNTIEPTSEKSWAVYERETQRASGSGAALPDSVRAASLRRGAAVGDASAARYRAWMVYWVDGQWTVSDVGAKVLQARGQLMGRTGDGAMVVLMTPLDATADERLRSLAEDIWAPLQARLEALRHASQGSNPSKAIDSKP